MTAKVVNSPRACARVVCHTGHTHTGVSNTGVLSDHAHVRATDAPMRAGNAQARVSDAQVRAENAQVRASGAQVRVGKGRRPFTEAEIAEWRERVFGSTVEDPVKFAVEEAVKLFGRTEDFTIWAWYANRIGVNNFLELYFELDSIMRTSTLRNPAAAFHIRLKRLYAAMMPKGGVA